METTIHRWRAEIAAEKWSPFRPHRGLAVSDLLLDNMLDRRIGRHARLTVRNPWTTYMGVDPKHVIRRVKLTEMLS
jgi:hypothetical protein